jgi:hypothetical protein
MRPLPFRALAPCTPRLSPGCPSRVGTPPCALPSPPRQTAHQCTADRASSILHRIGLRSMPMMRKMVVVAHLTPRLSPLTREAEVSFFRAGSVLDAPSAGTRRAHRARLGYRWCEAMGGAAGRSVGLKGRVSGGMREMRKARHGEYTAAWRAKPSQGTKDAGCEPQLGVSEIRSGSLPDLLERDMVCS